MPCFLKKTTVAVQWLVGDGVPVVLGLIDDPWKNSLIFFTYFIHTQKTNIETSKSRRVNLSFIDIYTFKCINYVHEILM